ncbi:uncharacterized protein LOC134300932 [Trichomycterus rosablanca]|uniref:uncharacterized protein LOC134300932 n=1 Tax=Trichomycterus rosablanca TaxID=2290929 RepID=UPI002F361092
MQPQNNEDSRRREFNWSREYKKESLKSCGTLLINSILKLPIQANQLNKHMDEMLHSIFFLGHIHEFSLRPKDFFPTFTSYKKMKSNFPEPFKKYNNHLPSRTPFSVLLSMMEKLYCTEERIIDELLLLLKKLNFPNPLHKPGNTCQQYYTLESTVICVCSGLGPQKYYGASLSCKGEAAKRIMIDVSCLKTWHEYVAHAVMSFYPDEASGDTITFPQSLRCQAYYRDWSKNVYEKRQPCLNCKNLFNLQNAETKRKDYPYGNCAETECLSKLLFNDQAMQEETEINNHTEENLEYLRYLTKERLIKHLNNVGINDILFYKPEPISFD